MTQAFETQDYAAWKALMQGKGKVTQVITEANFPQFAEAHALTLEGKVDEAKQIRTALGLGLDGGQQKGNGVGRYNQ
jgi:hypothetical protein